MFRTEKVKVATGWEKWLRANKLDSVPAVYNFTEGKIVTRSGTTEVRRVTLFLGNEQRAVYIKKYWANRFRQLWSGALRGTLFGDSKAKREFQNLSRLKNWKLDAPAPVAFGEERKSGWITRSFLISDEVPSPMGLDIFLRDIFPQLPPEKRRETKRKLFQGLAATARQLHKHRFVHHDLFWRNIILTGQSAERFFLIDAHKGRIWQPWNAQRSREQDLAALDCAAPVFFSRTDRLRFFLAYLQTGKLSRNDKEFLRCVLRKAEPMRSRQIQRVVGSRRTL